MHGGSEDEAQEAQPPAKDMFVVHKLSKLDTLAGLAIRYNVAVADIKRTNSLLSDSAMFARDTLLIPTRPLPMGNEYSAWAGLIVTQYGQVSRNLQDRPTLGYTGSGAPDNPSQTAIAQLRAHYGLSPASSPTATAGRAYATSEDGFSCGRPGELEMQDLHSGGGGGGGSMQRRPSLPELNSYAGERGGPPPGDERLRRRRAGELDEAWGAGDSAASGPSHAGHILPAASSAPLARHSPSRLGSPGAGPSRNQLQQPNGVAARQASGGLQPGQRRLSFLEKIKRAASQPALAAPQGPSLATAADSTIASVRRAPPELGARGVLHEAAAALQGPKASSKKE